MARNKAEDPVPLAAAASVGNIMNLEHDDDDSEKDADDEED